MKKILAVAILFVNLISFSNGCALAETSAAAPEIDGLYPRTARVIAFDYKNDLVVCVDWAELIWKFEGIEDWNLNDIASLIMYDNGTPESIYDDQIVSVRYGGWIE